VSIKYEPTKLLKKIAPKKKIEKLVNSNLTLKKSVLSMFDDIDFISKKTIEKVALKTVKQYKKRFKNEKESGLSASAAKEAALADKKLMVNRVQSAIVLEVSQEIKKEYLGEFYIWLPSNAQEPDPEHQLNYGSTFQVGKGEMPGERYGCLCGMDILVKGTKLDI
jgi:hypothetical protein